MKRVLICLLTMLTSTVSAGETYLVQAEQIDHFDVDYDACPKDHVCIFYGWYRYRLDGWAFDSGDVVDLRVAGNSHTWYRTDAPWIVTLEKTEGKSKYDFLDVDYIISDIEVFDHFVCTSDPKITGSIESDIAVSDEESEFEELLERDEKPECFSYYRLYDNLPD